MSRSWQQSICAPPGVAGVQGCVAPPAEQTVPAASTLSEQLLKKEEAPSAFVGRAVWTQAMGAGVVEVDGERRRRRQMSLVTPSRAHKNRKSV